MKKINRNFIVYAHDIDLTILKKAKKDKVIDEFFIKPELKFFKVDLIIFATPINTVAALLSSFKEFISPDTLITDVLSTKSNIIKLFNKYKLRFIGSHPLAGSEKDSYFNSKCNLFENNICVICETSKTRKKDLIVIKKFWRMLKMHTIVVFPKLHDELVAVTSHFIHVLSFSFVLYLKKKKINYKPFSGPSFKDFTRISSSNPKIWSNILFDNKNKINKVYNDFTKFLNDFMNVVNNSDIKKIEKKLFEIKNTEGK